MEIAEAAIRLGLVGVAFIGLMLVVYSVFAFITGENYKAFDDFADQLAVWTAIVGIVILIASIFDTFGLPPPPEPLTREFTAELLIVGTVIFAGFYLYVLGSGKKLSNHAANGLVLIALAASLLRIFPNPISH